MWLQGHNLNSVKYLPTHIATKYCYHLLPTQNFDKLLPPSCLKQQKCSTIRNKIILYHQQTGVQLQTYIATNFCQHILLPNISFYLCHQHTGLQSHLSCSNHGFRVKNWFVVEKDTIPSFLSLSFRTIKITVSIR